MSGDDTGRDPGLQPERTSLAWQRTALSAAGVAAVAAFAAVRIGVPWVAAAAGALALGALVVALAGWPRAVRDGREDISPWQGLSRAAVAVSVVAALSAVLALVSLANR